MKTQLLLYTKGKDAIQYNVNTIQATSVNNPVITKCFMHNNSIIHMVQRNISMKENSCVKLNIVTKNLTKMGHLCTYVDRHM